VAYRVYWRRAWAPDWEHELTVASGSEATLDGVSIDSVVIGVAAVGAGGQESLVSAYVAPSRARFDVKTK
jgi:hypothetical protein